MKLTESDIDAFLPTGRSYKKADGRGLYVFVTPSGTKFWRMNYRFGDKQKTLSLGPFPIVSLEQTRAACLHAKKLLLLGQSPSRVAREGNPCRRQTERTTRGGLEPERAKQSGAPELPAFLLRDECATRRGQKPGVRVSGAFWVVQVKRQETGDISSRSVENANRRTLPTALTGSRTYATGQSPSQW